MPLLLGTIKHKQTLITKVSLKAPVNNWWFSKSFGCILSSIWQHNLPTQQVLLTAEHSNFSREGSINCIPTVVWKTQSWRDFSSTILKWMENYFQNWLHWEISKERVRKAIKPPYIIGVIALKIRKGQNLQPRVFHSCQGIFRKFYTQEKRKLLFWTDDICGTVSIYIYVLN